MLAIDGCYIATADDGATEHPGGYLVIDGDRIAATGAGPLPPHYAAAERIDGAGLLATPGLVNTHHHLYQWITRGYATDDTLFGWLTMLYPVWAGLDADLVHAAAAANLGWLALTGCSTTTDHHYVFPAGRGDLLEARSSRPGGSGCISPGPGIDEPPGVRPAACPGFGRRKARRHPRGHAGGDRPLARPIVRGDDPDRGRAAARRSR